MMCLPDRAVTFKRAQLYRSIIDRLPRASLLFLPCCPRFCFIELIRVFLFWSFSKKTCNRWLVCSLSFTLNSLTCWWFPLKSRKLVVQSNLIIWGGELICLANYSIRAALPPCRSSPLEPLLCITDAVLMSVWRLACTDHTCGHEMYRMVNDMKFKYTPNVCILDEVLQT